MADAKQANPFDFSEDGLGGGGPDERTAVVVVVLDEGVDLVSQLRDRREGSAADGLLGDDAEPALHLVQPGGVGGRVVDVVAPAPRQPPPDLGVGTTVSGTLSLSVAVRRSCSFGAADRRFSNSLLTRVRLIERSKIRSRAGAQRAVVVLIEGPANASRSRCASISASRAHSATAFFKSSISAPPRNPSPGHYPASSSSSSSLIRPFLGACVAIDRTHCWAPSYGPHNTQFPTVSQNRPEATTAKPFRVYVKKVGFSRLQPFVVARRSRSGCRGRSIGGRRWR